MKTSLVALVTAAAMACGASNAASNPQKPVKKDTTQKVENPYCGKEGYECKETGWDVPSYDGYELKGEKTSKICSSDDNPSGKQTKIKLYVNSSTGDKFIENSYDGHVFGYNIESNGKRYGIANIDDKNDKVFETRSASDKSLGCPLYIR